MSLLNDQMPNARLIEVDRIAVAGEPHQVWEALRRLDGADLFISRLLFSLRVLPDRFGAFLARRQKPPPMHLRLMELGEDGQPGFFKLAVVPNEELAAAAIGKVWRLQIPFVAIDPSHFKAFDAPGFIKVAWSIRIDRRELAGSFVSFHLRVDATSEDAWRLFRRYWLLIGRFSRVLRRQLLRELRREVGAAVPDSLRALPGDDLVLDARTQRTPVRDIEAPPAKVWPWLMQIGADRAGWYSIDALDNAGRKSASEIIPRLQKLEVGDRIHGLPGKPDAFAVLRKEPEKVLVLGSPSLLSGDRTGPRSSWAFVLEPIGKEATHLITRSRAQWPRKLGVALLSRAFLLVHPLMQRAQLRHLKVRAELPAFA